MGLVWGTVFSRSEGTGLSLPVLGFSTTLLQDVFEVSKGTDVMIEFYADGCLGVQSSRARCAYSCVAVTERSHTDDDVELKGYSTVKHPSYVT